MKRKKITRQAAAGAKGQTGDAQAPPKAKVLAEVAPAPPALPAATATTNAGRTEPRAGRMDQLRAELLALERERPAPRESGANDKPDMDQQVPLASINTSPKQEPLAHPNPPSEGDAVPHVAPSAQSGAEEPPTVDTDPRLWLKPRFGSKLRAIYDHLVANIGYEVDAMTLQNVSNSLAVHSAIDQLRGEYHLVIINRTEGYSVDDEHWTTASFYRLIGRLPPDKPDTAGPPASQGGDDGGGGAGDNQTPAHPKA